VTSALRLAGLGGLAGALGWGAIVGQRALGAQPVLAVGWVQLGGRGLAGYAAASGLSYLVAYHAVFVLLGMVGADGVLGPAVAGAGAGACGSALLGALTIALTAAPPRILRASLVAGSAAGALFPLVPLGNGGLPLGMLAFLAAWQALYAASLAPLRAPVHAGVRAPARR
jgi:hypothetical protein